MKLSFQCVISKCFAEERKETLTVSLRSETTLLSLKSDSTGFSKFRSNVTFKYCIGIKYLKGVNLYQLMRAQNFSQC